MRGALRDTNALGFVEQMGGLDAVIGECGARLSGGQRQHLAIARALIHDPRVLVLDEATSALNTGSGRLVQDALAQLMQGRTTFVVAHRLTSVRGADRIVVIQEAASCNRGAHEALLAASGACTRLQGSRGDGWSPGQTTVIPPEPNPSGSDSCPGGFIHQVRSSIRSRNRNAVGSATGDNSADTTHSVDSLCGSASTESPEAWGFIAM